jgi:hypothetical protein
VLRRWPARSLLVALALSSPSRSRQSRATSRRHWNYPPRPPRTRRATRSRTPTPSSSRRMQVAPSQPRLDLRRCARHRREAALCDRGARPREALESPSSLSPSKLSASIEAPRRLHAPLALIAMPPGVQTQDAIALLCKHAQPPRNGPGGLDAMLQPLAMATTPSFGQQQRLCGSSHGSSRWRQRCMRRRRKAFLSVLPG